MARLRSDFWTSAYLRRRLQAGAPCVLRRRGAPEAGAIFIKIDRLDGTARLYGPAPPDLEEEPGDRRFALVADGDSLSVEDRLTREIGYDADLWIVEVEDRSGEPDVPLARGA